MTTVRHSEKLEKDATIAIIGGGPAGSFQAIHLLNQARQRRHRLRVVIFERRRQPAVDAGGYEGCPQCAGGISPRLNEALTELSLAIPADVVQARISAITVQGNWKHIRLPVPENRQMLSVYRGALPYRHHTSHNSFDSLLLDHAVGMGAQLIAGRVTRAFYDHNRRPVLCYEQGEESKRLTADFAVFAGGVNEKADPSSARRTSADLFMMLQPLYRPPLLRKALIFELEAPGGTAEPCEGEMHFIESSMDRLRLDMCSIIPKRGYFTVSVIGKSVDESVSHKQNLQLIHDFLAIPQIRRTLPPETQLHIRCVCNPSIVVGTATHPIGHRTAVVGDMATSRQYKDGILSACNMSRGLAVTLFEEGIDTTALQAGFGPILAGFQRDNRFATLIFFMYRWFFTSPFLSRVIYQTYASERKTRHHSKRDFERIFWNISSGDESYERIAWSMLKPATLWQILSGGMIVTARNWLTERFFGLDWTGIGRFPTAVPREQLEERRDRLLDGKKLEFECTYTIDLRAPAQAVLALLGEFGESSRTWLKPRWVHIGRTSGKPLSAGTVINYRVFAGLISFSIEQQASDNQNLVLYRIRDGFAHGGSFLFEVEPGDGDHCHLTVYLAFDYKRGHTLAGRLYWRLFRLLFPEFIHEVLWNHAFCQFKQMAEAVDLDSESKLIHHLQL